MDDTWKCHVCGEERPDHFISVHHNDRTYQGLRLRENVRYCNDREGCRRGAADVTFLPKEA